MDSEQRRKRKRFQRPYSKAQFFSVRSLILCSSFFVFLLFLSSDRFPFRAVSFHPVVKVPALSLISSYSVTDSFNQRLLSFRVEDRVLFPDHLLLMLSTKINSSLKLDCVYYKTSNTSSSDAITIEGVRNEGVSVQSALSVDVYDEVRSIVRCPLPLLNYSATAELRRRGGGGVTDYDWSAGVNQMVHKWDKVAYEAVLDGNTAVVFIKGLNLRPHRESNPTYFRCRFGLGNGQKDEGFALVTKAVGAAQEVVRCLLPRSIRNNPEKAQGIQVTILHGSANVTASSDHVVVPSVARIGYSGSYEQRKSQRRKYKDRQIKRSKAGIYNSNSYNQKNIKKYELCACTMLWNQASSIREWIMYHAWLGVERWFIYDNNSDDGIEKMIEELESENYNVSRHTWPWIKTQEAGFSHCALRAKNECNWVGFFDVDEFFYLPTQHRHGYDGRNSLRSIVANYSSSTTIAEIRTACHSFGPSGLSSAPLQGVTVGYTCRLQSPERHKSIVRPDLLNVALLNVVHHFGLKEGYRYLNMPEGTAVINHYKYQVWESFRAKFFRRVATYVVDWQENQNKGSKDRAPGLGTEAIEPSNWRLKFCEVWDTGLRDFILANFADPATASLPWERTYL